MADLQDLAEKASNKQSEDDKIYTALTENWFQSFPYGFQAIIDGVVEEFYLPINPQNLNITTHFSTNIVPTLYSTVEEHSDVRYFDIVISGTTGFAPQYVSTEDTAKGDFKNGGLPLMDNEAIGLEGRLDYGDSGSVFGGLAGGFFASTLGKVDQAINQASNAINALLGKARPFSPGVFSDASGYLAFHNLYRFLLRYKQAAVAGKSVIKLNNDFANFTPGVSLFGLNEDDEESEDAPTGFSISSNLSADLKDQQQTPLYFMNYKDNNQYSCIVERFLLQRSAENPMLYNYTITLKAYNLSKISDKSISDSLSNRLTKLGLTSGPSLLARIKGAVRGAKGAANSVGGAFSTLGS